MRVRFTVLKMPELKYDYKQAIASNRGFKFHLSEPISLRIVVHILFVMKGVFPKDL